MCRSTIALPTIIGTRCYFDSNDASRRSTSEVRARPEKPGPL